jgi:hypothetical protein
MATLLKATDFTDLTLRPSVEASKNEVGGDNTYLSDGDLYYYDLLRERGISATDPDLVIDPWPLKVKYAVKCWVSVNICRDLLENSDAPYDNQVINADKFDRKLGYYEKCLEDALSKLDDNIFTGGDKSDETSIVNTFSRG